MCNIFLQAVKANLYALNRKINTLLYLNNLKVILCVGNIDSTSALSVLQYFQLETVKFEI